MELRRDNAFAMTATMDANAMQMLPVRRCSLPSISGRAKPLLPHHYQS
jgi:hypothetical protein